jgi:transcriptional regulator with XRE-family HTH domain
MSRSKGSVLDPAERRRRALRSFLAREGLKVAEVARVAGVNANSLYNFLRGRSGSLSVQTLEALSRAYHTVSISDLTGDISVSPRMLRMVPVKAIAQSGVWSDSSDLPIDQQYEIPIPSVDGLGGNFAVLTLGNSADQLFPSGAHVIISEMQSFDRSLETGDIVLIRATEAGKHSLSLRQLEFRGGQCWAWLRSSDPLHQGAIPVPMPYRGEIWRMDNQKLVIVGVAVAVAYSLVRK